MTRRKRATGAGYAGGDASTAAAKLRREAALGLLPVLRGASLSSAALSLQRRRRGGAAMGV
jgi:hypothetical protein